MSEQQVGEVDAATVYALFQDRFVAEQDPVRLLGYRLERNGHDAMVARVSIHGEEHTLHGEGQGAISAFVNAWTRYSGQQVNVVDYAEHALGEGTDAEAAAYVQLSVDGERVSGAARDRDTVSAALKAVLSALNRDCVQRARAGVAA